MLIVTAKVPRRKLALGALAAAVLCCCALFIARPAHGLETSAAIHAKDIKNNEGRVAYLEEYGWQVKPDPLAVQELIVPKKFDESYEQYLTLQQEQGFDPEQYAGKRVKRYTYEITNYPTGESGVQINLLLLRGKVVGGEVLSPKADGFLHGLNRPTT